MAKKTAKGIDEYCKIQVGNPYWYCSQGQEPTLSWLNQKIAQYPSKWTQPRINKAKGEAGKFPRCYDCVGLIKGYLWSDTPSSRPKYESKSDKSADGMRGISNARPISTIPEIPGILVFMSGHVGVYIGDGRVIEAWGFRQVDNHPISFQKWTTWGFCPFIDYEGADKDYKPENITKPTPTPKPTPKPAPAAKKNKFKVGDVVKFKDDATVYHAGSVNIPASVKTRQFTISQITFNGQQVIREGQVCALLKEINSWAAEDNIELVNKAAKSDSVVVKFVPDATRYHEGGPTIPAWVKTKTFTIAQTDYKKGSGKKMIRGGQECILLKEINTWAAIDNLVEV